MISKEKLSILFVSICMAVVGYIIEYFLGQQKILFTVAVALEVMFGATIFITLVDFYNTVKKTSTKILLSSLQTLLGVGAYVLSLYCIHLGLFCFMSSIFSVASLLLTLYYTCKYMTRILFKK